jgi:hypothetical protein
MKGLPRAIVLGLLSSFAGERREHLVPSSPRHGASASWEWHCQALEDSWFLEVPAQRGREPRVEILGSGKSGAHTPGVCFPTSRGAPRQPGSGAVCGFRISCRCHPERPADRQGSRPLSKTPFHLPGLITPAERRRGHWSQPPPFSPGPAPKPPASGTLPLPPLCLFQNPGGSLSTCQLWLL